MSGNRMAYPLLISVANIDLDIRSKISMHTYLLLSLLPIPKFTHKNSRIRGLHNRLIHQALAVVLEPLKTAVRVRIMMNDPVGNLQYCFTPLAAYIVDTPELSLMACTNSKASPFTTATSKHFGDSFLHPPHTGLHTLAVICHALNDCPPNDYAAFLKVIKKLQLNGVVEPFWEGWPLSCPSRFFHPESLHHFLHFSWDHIGLPKFSSVQFRALSSWTWTWTWTESTWTGSPGSVQVQNWFRTWTSNKILNMLIFWHARKSLINNILEGSSEPSPYLIEPCSN